MLLSVPPYQKLIGTVLKSTLPAPAYRAIHTYVARRRSNLWLSSVGAFSLAQEAASRFNYTVQSGPFKGLKYSHRAILTRHATPTLLGTYERQLHPFLDAANHAEIIIDIGTAEGYYAVGLARMTARPVVTFDCNPGERKICREMAKANGVADRISIRKWCDGDTLINLTRNRKAFIFCDIDGGELDLFTPQVISSIRHCDLIIELHGDTASENREFINRFRDIHNDLMVIDHPDEPSGAEMLHFLGADAPRMATEYRSFQQWLVLQSERTAHFS